MLRKLTHDRAAEIDLIEIWIYTLERWNEPQADRYLGLIEDAVRRLVVDPTVGTRRRKLNRDGYWSQRVGRHVVFTRLHPSPSECDACCTNRWMWADICRSVSGDR